MLPAIVSLVPGFSAQRQAGRLAMGRTPPLRLQAADPPPALPAEGNAASASRLLVLGESASLDELGPVVVTEGGQLRYIDNWADMTDAERETTQRVIARRNAARLKTLRGGSACRTAQHGTPQGAARRWRVPAPLSAQPQPLCPGSGPRGVTEVGSSSQLRQCGLASSGRAYRPQRALAPSHLSQGSQTGQQDWRRPAFTDTAGMGTEGALGGVRRAYQPRLGKVYRPTLAVDVHGAETVPRLRIDWAVPAWTVRLTLPWLPAAASAVETSGGPLDIGGPRMGDFSGGLLDVLLNNFALEALALGVPVLGILAIAIASWRNPKTSADPSYFKRRHKRE